MNQDWFELKDIRSRFLRNSVWMPLRAILKKEAAGKDGYVGYKEDFFGAGSIAVPINRKSSVEDVDWMDIGIDHTHRGYVQDDNYSPSDVYEDIDGELLGIHLVLDQHLTGQKHHEWHLHQDLVTSLDLLREGDIWVCPSEGYLEIVRLKRGADGRPELLEIRAEHLRDYLCARKMGLYITSYYSRDEILGSVNHIEWVNGGKEYNSEEQKWEGRIMEIHEGGGEPYGESMAVLHVARTDVDEADDVPDISEPPTDENTSSESWSRGFEGRKLYRVMGELWRNEWVEPARVSPRIRGDKLPATIFFVADAEGTKESKDTLRKSGKWLWFRPDVVMALAHRRGGSLKWYTRDTGRVWCSPDCGVHFGVNGLGLLNVYAKDIVLLPEWQQQIWAGYNIGPEGGISDELLASQVRATPASTKSPEAFFADGLELLKELSFDIFGVSIIREHELTESLLTKIHRFRAIDKEGLYALAKDIARLTADCFDHAEIQKVVSPVKGEKWGSLKSLEKLLATKVGNKDARLMMGPLVGVYELRHADAHLPSNDVDDALVLVNVDQSTPFVVQGFQMLHSCVSSIYSIAEVLKKWTLEESNNEQN